MNPLLIFGSCFFLKFSLVASGGATTGCSPGEAEIWVTEPWTFGEDSIGEGLLNRGCLSSTQDSNLPNLVSVNTGSRKQTIEGFGASMTAASAWVIWRHPAKDAILRDLFNPESGNGMSYVRIPVSLMSDFMARDGGGEYTYIDDWDSSLNSFSISKDLDYFIPILKQAKAENPALKVMAVPWSAPGWMKTSNHQHGGKFKSENTDLYARYLAMYIEAYEQQGIRIDTFVPQNEPGFEPNGYPSMILDSTQEAELIKKLVEEFNSRGIDTKILIYGHNWSNLDYARDILNNQEVRPHIEAVAFHCYEGDYKAPGALNQEYGIDTYFTECSPSQSSRDQVNWAAGDMGWWNTHIYAGQIKFARARAVTGWNIALDWNFGPNMYTDFYNGNCPAFTACGCEFCTPFIFVDEGAGTYTKKIDFWTSGHYSKFVKPGAVVVDVTGGDGGGSGIEAVAFANPDNSVVVVAHNNKWDGSQAISVQVGGRNFRLPDMAQESMATYKFS